MPSKQANQAPFGLSIAIPTSFIDVDQSRAQQTQHIGRIARAVAIFQVDEIVIYLDKSNPKQMKNLKFISKVLEYIETPQYLRKHLFGKIPELQHVGRLPPLRTPHHPLVKEASKLQNGEFREGVAFTTKGKMVVDVGVESPLPLMQFKFTRKPRRITVQIQRDKSGKITAHPSSPPRFKQYWGYSVKGVESSLGDFLVNTANYKLVIATSRKGKPFTEEADKIRTQWEESHRLLLLFGSHREGLSEILSRDRVDLAAVSNTAVNLVFNQGTATIRTEEAVFIGLSAFRLLEHRKN
jgi:predicted SPOUT superfamily RNA methylase MTH1